MTDSIFLLGAEQKLVEMAAQPYDSEDLLQSLLAEYPGLIVGQQIDQGAPRRWLLITREMAVPGEEGGSGRWSLDHLFLDQDGIPTLIEVKRSTDSRIRRELVGQMLDYAANGVVHWPVEEIRARFVARHADDECAKLALRDFLDERDDADSFWSRVKTNLQAGKVRMIFVADAVPPELKRIVEFLNAQMDPAEVLALEIKQYVGRGLRTLVPRVFGKTAEAESKKNSGSSGVRWDEATFFAHLLKNAGQDAVEVARRILEWAKKKASRTWWGTGNRDGSFIPVIEHAGVSHSILAVYTYGRVELSFQNLKKNEPFSDDALRVELLRRLNNIPGITLPEDAITRRPSIPLTVLAQGDALAKFLTVLDWVAGQIEASDTEPDDGDNPGHLSPS